MPGPYRRLDVPNVNQHVVTAPPAKVKKAAAKVAADHPVVTAPADTAESADDKSTAKATAKTTAKTSAAKKA